MAKNLLNKKYYPLIWVVLVIASLIANIYSIYLSFIELETVTIREIIINIFRALFIEGAMPAVWCFVFAIVVYSIGARRYYGVISRNDFVYIVMAFTAVARIICGVIECFCILEPRIYVITSSMLSFVVLTIAYALMYFLVIDKRYKMNPIERFGAFSTWAGVYLLFIGISVIVLNTVYLLVFNDEQLLELVNEALVEIAGIVLVKDSLQIVASAIALSLYGVIVIVAVVIGEIMRNKAKHYQAPETRGDYFDNNPNRPYEMRNDTNDIYGFDPNQNQSDDPNKKDGDDNNSGGNVFDEFDI